MSVTSTGSRGEPQFASSGNAPTFAADLTELSNYAAEVGNRVVGTQAQRDAYTPWEGLEWENTTDGYTYKYLDGVWRLTSTNDSPPPLFVGRIRRSDGQLVLNNGTTALRWQSTPSVPAGYVATADGNGAVLTVPAPGIYRVSASLQVATASAAYGSIGVTADGATAYMYTQPESNWPGGFNTFVVTAEFYIPNTSTKIWFPVTSNTAGTIRVDGTVRVFRAV